VPLRYKLLPPVAFALACAGLAAWLALTGARAPWAVAGSAMALGAVAVWLAWRVATLEQRCRVSVDQARRRADRAESELQLRDVENLDIASNLADSEIRFLKVFRYNPIAMALVRPDLTIAHTNHRFRSLSGGSKDELAGRCVTSVVESGDRDTLRELVKGALAEQPTEGWAEVRFVDHGRGCSWTRVSSECIQNARGEVIFALIMAEDISDRKRFDEVREAYRERLETLSRKLLQAQEDERRRVARELHDELGQNMAAVKLGLQVLREPPEDWSGRVDELSARVDQLIAQVRRLSRQLRPSVLDDLGLPAALRWLVDQYRQDHGLNLHLVIEGLEERASPWVESACFRVVQEALNNVARHADASSVSVRLSARDGVLRFSIDDDGRGFDPSEGRRRASEGHSLGLLGMEDRIRLLGGRFRIRSTPGEGARIEARIPLTRNSAESPSVTQPDEWPAVDAGAKA
jgi:two-component system sensor histidine kinase UhpB